MKRLMIVAVLLTTFTVSYGQEIAEALEPIADAAWKVLMCELFDSCPDSGPVPKPTPQPQGTMVFVGTAATGGQVYLTFLNHQMLRMQYPGVDVTMSYSVQQVGLGEQLLTLYWNGMPVEQLHVRFHAQTTGIYRHILRSGVPVDGTFHIMYLPRHSMGTGFR